MKAVIALSGLAGLIIFGPPVVFHRSHHPDVSVIVREAVRQSTPAGDQSQCRFEAQRNLTVEATSGDALRLLAGSGSLEVVGVEGLGAMRAVARACASEEAFLDDLRLTSERDGSTLVLETHYPEWGRQSWGNRYARLDLKVEVPAGMAAEIQDGSGEMSVTNLGSLNIDDGSGNVVISRIQGDVWLDDGAGEIEIRDVQGSVGIDDGSGEIGVRSVSGDLVIDDSSGEIAVQGVGGSLTLSDSSGEIDVRDVAMDVRVTRDSSGDIQVAGVGRDFIVERDGSGSIRYTDVEGRIDVPRKK